MTRREEAGAVGKHVMAKIRPLQKALDGSGAASGSARASLAQLRHLGRRDARAWMAAGDLVFEDWPSHTLGSPEENPRALAAVCSTLSLYAFHRRSQSAPHEGSLGGACRALVKIDSARAKGIERRLAAVEAAPDFAGVTRSVRSLVQLLRSQDVALDYDRLARDLYLVQFPYEKDAVIRRWAQDYYLEPPKKRETGERQQDAMRGEVSEPQRE